MTPKAFRVLIVAQWLLTAAGVVATFATDHRLPATLRVYQDAQADASFDGAGTNDLILLSLGVLLYLTVTAGLFLFKRWARTLLPFSLIANAVALASLGPMVAHAAVAAIEYVASIVDGVILATAFFSPVAALFRRADRPDVEA